ncbi:MAG: GNAT family N-acetyltransferase, partial [Janthinobacterium sp.]
MTSPSTIDWHFSRFADLTPFDLYDVLAARQNVFILEQTCLYSDIDGYDLEAHHLLGWRDV